MYRNYKLATHVSAPTHIPTKRHKLDADYEFYFKHGIHPSQVGVRLKNQRKQFF